MAFLLIKRKYIYGGLSQIFNQPQLTGTRGIRQKSVLGFMLESVQLSPSCLVYTG